MTPIWAQWWEAEQGLAWLSFMVGAMPLDGMVSYWLRHRRLWGKPYRGWGVLLPCYDCSGSKQGPRAAPSGRRVAKASFPA
jgi:hypothetical protein